MSTRYTLSLSSKDNYTFRVIAYTKADCQSGYDRITRYFQQVHPQFKALGFAPSCRDGLWAEYYPIPDWVYSTLIRLVDAMVKSGVDLQVYSQWRSVPVTFSEPVEEEFAVEEEVYEVVSPFAGMNLESMTKARLISLAKEHGVRIGSKLTKQQVIESLQDHIVEVAV